MVAATSDNNLCLRSEKENRYEGKAYTMPDVQECDQPIPQRAVADGGMVN